MSTEGAYPRLLPGFEMPLGGGMEGSVSILTVKEVSYIYRSKYQTVEARVVVRLDDRDVRSAAHLLGTADGGGQVERVGGQVSELGLDGSPFGAAGGVVQVRLVGGSRGCGDRVHARDALRRGKAEPTRADRSPGSAPPDQSCG